MNTAKMIETKRESFKYSNKVNYIFTTLLIFNSYYEI